MIATLPQIVVGGFGTVLILGGAVMIAFALGLGGRADAYDSIGAGIFDRSGGHDGRRPPSDAEYEEFAAAIAAVCAEDDRRRSSTPRPSARRGRSGHRA